MTDLPQMAQRTKPRRVIVRLTEGEYQAYLKAVHSLSTTRSRMMRLMIRGFVDAGPDFLPPDLKTLSQGVFQLGALGLHFPKGRIVKGRGLHIKLSRGERVRTVMGVPQAVVRVISYARGSGVAKSVDYIDRKGELELETESGERIKGREEAKALV